MTRVDYEDRAREIISSGHKQVAEALAETLRQNAAYKYRLQRAQASIKALQAQLADLEAIEPGCKGR